MTITIHDETLAEKLRAAAAARGEDPNHFAVAAIADALAADAYDPDALSPEEITQSREGIRRGLEDGAAGRVTPFEEWATQVHLRRQHSGGRRQVTG